MPLPSAFARASLQVHTFKDNRRCRSAATSLKHRSSLSEKDFATANLAIDEIQNARIR